MKAVSVLMTAQRPLVIVGKGAAFAKAEIPVRKLVRDRNLPFLATPMGKGESHSQKHIYFFTLSPTYHSYMRVSPHRQCCWILTRFLSFYLPRDKYSSRSNCQKAI